MQLPPFANRVRSSSSAKEVTEACAANSLAPASYHGARRQSETWRIAYLFPLSRERSSSLGGVRVGA